MCLGLCTFVPTTHNKSHWNVKHFCHFCAFFVYPCVCVYAYVWVCMFLFFFSSSYTGSRTVNYIMSTAGERATRQHNMSVNNRLAAQWRHYRSRDVWLSWDPSLPRGRKNTSPLCNLISQCLARFGCLVPGQIVKQRETFTVSDRSRYSAEGGGLNCQVVYCISWSNVWQEHLQWNI